MPKKKLSVDDISELIDECGLEEAILYSCDADEIADSALSMLWEQAQQLLSDILSHIDGHTSTDFFNEDTDQLNELDNLLDDEDI